METSRLVINKDRHFIAEAEALGVQVCNRKEAVEILIFSRFKGFEKRLWTKDIPFRRKTGSILRKKLAPAQSGQPGKGLNRKPCQKEFTV